MSDAQESAAAKDPMNLVWVDMEMTGLSPDTDRVLEIAMVVTTPALDILAEAPVIVLKQPDAVLDAMDAWNKGTHGKSGLIDRVKASTVDETLAEEQFLAFLRAWVPRAKSPMCGNSICQDRRFMARWLPQLESYFHYRNIDVSTLKELARRWKPDVVDSFRKAQEHTALADIRESIEELRHYRAHFLRPDLA